MTTATNIDDLSATTIVLAEPRTRVAGFLQLTKPRMNLLIVATTAVGFYMAARGYDWVHFGATILGTALTAAGAGALNQVIERKFDAQMPRTRSRPIPTKLIDPSEAMAFGIALSVVGVGVLACFVNLLTAGLGAFTLLSYVLVYTPLKRRTTLNTVIGAVPGAIPPVMGFTAAHGSITPGALAIFAILFIWQMPHFLAIAILYRRDYLLAGFRMLPVVDQDLSITGRQIILYSAALIPVSMVPTLLHMDSMGYFYASIVLGFGFLYYGVRCAGSRQRSDARNLFVASIIYNPLILLAMMVFRTV